MRKVIEELRYNGHPTTHLYNLTKPEIRGTDVLKAFMDPKGLASVLLTTYGRSFAKAMLKPGGVKLTPDFRLENKDGEVGLAITGGELDEWRFIVHTLFAALSKEQTPLNVEGEFISPIFLAKQFSEILTETESVWTCVSNMCPNAKLVTTETFEWVKVIADAKKATGVENDKSYEDKARLHKALNSVIDWFSSNSSAKVLVAKADEVTHPKAVQVEINPTRTAHVDFDTIINCLQILSNILGIDPRTQKPLLELRAAPEGIVMIVDSVVNYEIQKGGDVFRNGQRIQNMLVMDSNGNPNLYVGYGALLFMFLSQITYLKGRRANNDVYELGKWERAHLRKHLPLDNEDLAGSETHGLRVQYNQNVAHGYTVNSSQGVVVTPQTTIVINGIPISTGGITMPVYDLKREIKPEWAQAVLLKYNLFFSDKSGVFMDGRLLAFRIKHLPLAEQESIANAIYRLAGGTQKLFGFEYKNDTERGILFDESVVIKTKKDKKPVPRIQLQHPTASNYLPGGVLSALIDSSHIRPNFTGWYMDDEGGLRDIVHIEPVVLGMNITSTAGTAVRWVPMPYALVQKNYSDNIEKFMYDKTTKLLSNIELLGGEYTEEKKVDGRILWTFTSNGTIPCRNPFDESKSVVIKDYAGYDENGVFNSKVDLKGSYFGKGSTILMIGYKIGEELLYHEIKAEEDILVTGVELFVNGFGTLDYKVFGLYVINAWKMRGVMKAMPATSVTGKWYLYNSLNFIPEGVNMVVTKDCIKHKDVLIGDLPYVAATALHNGYGHMLAEINKSLGYDEYDNGLLFDALPAATGAYSELRKWFWERYGQPLWVYRREVMGGAWDIVERGFKERLDGDSYFVQYTVQHLEEEGIVPVGKFPTHSANGQPTLVVASDVMRKGSVSVYDDIFVIYYDDHPHCPMAVWQRSYAAGSIENEEGKTEHVYAEMKVELSDFRANCTTAKLMQGVINNVSTDNGLSLASPAYAAKLNEDYKQRIDKYCVFNALTQGLPIYKDGQQLPEVPVFGPDGQLSDEFFARYGQKAVDQGLLDKVDNQIVEMKDFYNLFNDAILVLNETKVFVPAIAEQDMKGTSTESTSGLLRSILVDLFCMAKASDISQRTNRLRAATATVVGKNIYDERSKGGEKLNIQRQMTQGRESCLAKLVAIEGLPFKTVIPYSDVEGSACQNYLKAMKKVGWTKEELLAPTLWETKPTDPRCIFHRSPLTSQHYAAVVIVRPGQYIMRFPDEGAVVDLYWALVNYGQPSDPAGVALPGNIFVIYQQSKMILIQMGDCDGRT